MTHALPPPVLYYYIEKANACREIASYLSMLYEINYSYTKSTKPLDIDTVLFNIIDNISTAIFRFSLDNSYYVNI